MLSTAVRTVEVTKGWLAFFENSRFLTASAKAEVMIVLSLFVNVARKESSPSSMELRNYNHLDHERDRCACVFRVSAILLADSPAAIRQKIRSLAVVEIFSSLVESDQEQMKRRVRLVLDQINDCHKTRNQLHHCQHQETTDCSQYICVLEVCVHGLGIV